MTTSGAEDVVAFRRALRRAETRLSRSLPWIGHADPWAVLVSEVMLQQTQSTRVLEPWTRFLERFPTPVSCADATLADVLRLWSGLGYPRRAKALHAAAGLIVREYAGSVPASYEELRKLPGVGEYTANAVASFAFHLPRAVVDTNVARVLARAVANRPLGVKEVRGLAETLLPARDSSRFNQAMIDLGAQFCRSSPRCGSCPMRRVCRWTIDGGDDPAPASAGVSRPQSRFAGSARQLRGRVLAEVRVRPLVVERLRVEVGDVDEDRFRKVLGSLERDGLIEVDTLVRLVGD